MCFVMGLILILFCPYTFLSVIFCWFRFDDKLHIFTFLLFFLFVFVYTFFFHSFFFCCLCVHCLSSDFHYTFSSQLHLQFPCLSATPSLSQYPITHFWSFCFMSTSSHGSFSPGTVLLLLVLLHTYSSTFYRVPPPCPSSSWIFTWGRLFLYPDRPDLSDRLDSGGDTVIHSAGARCWRGAICMQMQHSVVDEWGSFEGDTARNTLTYTHTRR